MENALVILCGGNSTRMGTDKALLPFGDTCLIEYLVRKFQPYFSRIYLSVKIKGDYSHLKLPVTEIPDIYPNQGPMSGIFSGLSMIDEECAFFMSVDTPFLEPKTGLVLLSELGDADICTLEGKASYLETATAAYSKNCITTIGKCLLLHQLTFNTLREKCSTRYVTEGAIAEDAPTPIDIQYYNLDTRDNYYHALRILSGIVPPDSSQALIEYFKDTRDLFLHTTPVISFVAKPGTIMTPLIERLLPLLEREGLKVVHLIKEDSSVVFKNVFFEKKCAVYQHFPVETYLAEQLFSILKFLELIPSMEVYDTTFRLLEQETVDGRHIYETLSFLCGNEEVIPQEKRIEMLESYDTYTYMKKRWEKYVRKQGIENVSWETVLRRMVLFLRPVWNAMCRDEVFFGDWMPDLERYL